MTIAIELISRRRASASALITLAELPLVEIASSVSPARPWAITCRANIASVPMSLAIAVRIAASSVRSIARLGFQRGSMGERKSATASIESVAEPPFPSASSRPPAPRSARSAEAAAVNTSWFSVRV